MGIFNVTVITPGGGSTSQEMDTYSAEAFNAYSIQVRYQSTDFLPTTASSSPTSTSLSTPTSSTLTDSDMPSTGNQNGVTPGTAAGIAIGALAGLLIVFGVVWYLIRRNARQKQTPRNPSSDISPSQQQHHSYLPPLLRVVFLNRKNDENPRFELPGQSRLEIPQELSSDPHPR
ncbi:hypothetical protein GGR58DRAFT_509261 [Xylaria digitata]|nr:hypothetical protein GGR58DRAFT_509261 [Xylaria digitata]